MRIALTRSGGFAGTRLHLELDTAHLPPGEAQQLRTRVAAADLVSSGSPAARDAFTYDLAIEDDGRLKTCRTDDTAMSDRTRALVDWLLEHAPRV
jgi:hypothetical protein